MPLRVRRAPLYSLAAQARQRWGMAHVAPDARRPRRVGASARGRLPRPEVPGRRCAGAARPRAAGPYPRGRSLPAPRTASGGGAHLPPGASAGRPMPPDSAVSCCGARAPPAAQAAAGGARAIPPERPGRGSPSGGAASSAPSAKEGFRGPMAAGLAPGAAGGAAVLAEGGSVRRPPRSPPGRGRAGLAPATPSAPREAPGNSVGPGGSRPLGRRGGAARRLPAAGRAECGAGVALRHAAPLVGARPAGSEARGSAEATWLILPVVICLSQRLSHACASISNRTKRNCEWLIKSVIVYLIVPTATRITVVILELIRARNRDFGSGVFIGLENRRPPPGPSRPGGGTAR